MTSDVSMFTLSSDDSVLILNSGRLILASLIVEIEQKESLSKLTFSKSLNAY